MNARRRVYALILSSAVVGLGARGVPSYAGLVIDVPVTVDGMPNTSIGSINVTNDASTFEITGVFTFSNPWGVLDNCYDFRWFQIITDLPANFLNSDAVKYKDADGNYTVSPMLPFVDPPPGGYQYQAPKGADNDPYYENTDPGMYYFSNFSETHIENVGSLTTDQPAGIGNGEKISFQTYLVATGPCIGDMKFSVLAGYYWDVMLDAQGNPSMLVGNALNLGTLESQLPLLNHAMDSTGFAFSSWEAVTGVALSTDCCVPEPGTLALAAAGLLLLALRSLRTRPLRAI